MIFASSQLWQFTRTLPSPIASNVKVTLSCCSNALNVGDMNGASAFLKHRSGINVNPRSNGGYRSIAHDSPAQSLADFPQRVGAFISEDDEVVRHERHHEIVAVTTDRYCSLLSLENVVVCFCCWH